MCVVFTNGQAMFILVIMSALVLEIFQHSLGMHVTHNQCLGTQKAKLFSLFAFWVKFVVMAAQTKGENGQKFFL